MLGKIIMRFAETHINGGVHEVIDFKRFDGFQCFIDRGVIKDVNSIIRKGLGPDAFKACSNVIRTVEGDDVNRDLRRHHSFSTPMNAFA